MIVRESLASFTRDGNPFRKLKVGQTVVNDKVKFLPKWGYGREFVEQCEVSEYIKGYKGHSILVLYFYGPFENRPEMGKRYIGCYEDTTFRTPWCETSEEALERVKKELDSIWPERFNEAQNFTRDMGGSVEKIGIGRVEIFKTLIRELAYDSLLRGPGVKPNFPESLDEISEKNMYIIDSRKFIYEYGNTPKDSVKYDLMTKIMDKVTQMNPNKLEHNAAGWVRVFFTFNRMDEIWNAPKTWISEQTWSELRQMDEKTLIEKAKEQLTVNRCMVLCAAYGSDELMKWALENGCTNANTNTNEPIQQACRRGELEMVKLLLTHPEVDPADTTRDGKKYKNDEHQYCIRQAAKEGHADVVELLMKDKRVDPSYRTNWALAQAVANHHIDVCKLLVRDQRVRNKINYMKPVDVKRFDELRKSGQL